MGAFLLFFFGSIEVPIGPQPDPFRAVWEAEEEEPETLRSSWEAE